MPHLFITAGPTADPVVVELLRLHVFPGVTCALKRGDDRQKKGDALRFSYSSWRVNVLAAE